MSRHNLDLLGKKYDDFIKINRNLGPFDIYNFTNMIKYILFQSTVGNQKISVQNLIKI